MIAPLVRKHATGWKTLFLLIVTQLVYAFMILVTIPEVSSYANGLQLLDVMPFGYDLAYVETLFDKLGPEGRRAYKMQQLPVDMVYPILFGLSFSLLLAYVLKRTLPENSPLYLLCFLPFIVTTLDYLENFRILQLLNSYPSFSPDQISRLSQITVWKSILTVTVFLILIPAVIAWFLKRREDIHLFGTRGSMSGNQKTADG